MALQHSSVPRLKLPVTCTNIFTWTGLECMQRTTDILTEFTKTIVMKYHTTLNGHFFVL
jgi:hypothetical protein